MNFTRKILISLSIFLLPFFISGFAHADTLGQSRKFFVNSGYDNYGRTSLSAILKIVSDRAYFYVDDKYWNSLSAYGRDIIMVGLQSLAAEFDNNIYPGETSFWGSEAKPGVDNDPHILILLEDLSTGNGGYFETKNLFSKNTIEDSNESEMIVVNTNAIGTDYIKNFVAHELQHVISFNQKEILNESKEDIWLNELRSEYSVSLLGYNDIFYGSNLDRRMRDFVDNPSDSLTEWPNVKTDYAMAAVFGQYLVERFGRDILAATLRYGSYSISSLNQYLNKFSISFGDVFLEWMAANYLNDRSIDSRFGYIGGGLKTIKVTPQSSVYLSSSTVDYNNMILIKDWQPYWIEYKLQSVTDKTKSLKFDITGQSGQNFLVSYAAFYNDGQIKGGGIPLINGRAVGYIKNFQDKQLTKVILMMTNGQKTVDFTKNEAASAINIKATLADNTVLEAVLEAETLKDEMLKDGVLIKKPYEKDIYVIWGKYKRYLNSDIIKLYGHLDPAKAIEVSPETFNSYQTSNYVKYINKEKVYAVWPPGEGSRGGTSMGIASDGTKHWLNITPEQWDASGRDWGAIFVVSDLELNAYKIGSDIIR